MEIVLHKSKYPLVLRYSKKHNIIWALDVPIKSVLKNERFLRQELEGVNFNYDRTKVYRSNIHDENNKYTRIVVEKDNKLEAVSKYNFVYYNKPKELILYASFRIDSFKNSQKLYDKYRVIFSENDLNRMEIGTIDEVGVKHPELLNLINKGELYFKFRKKGTVRNDEIRKYISF